MRIEIDKAVLDDLKENILEHLKNIGYMSNNYKYYFIKERLDEVKNLYVENLSETRGSKMCSRADDIAIDKVFVNLSEEEKVLGFKEKYYRLIMSQLTHELWHNASRNVSSKRVGIKKTRDFLVLNEGITQMLTEDTTGIVVSKYTDSSYKDFKNMAKIIRASVGNSVILDSYLNHNDSLDVVCDRIANDYAFFDNFNKKLSDAYLFSRLICKNDNLSKELKESVLKMYKRRIELQYKSLIINIVLPKYKSLSSTVEKKEYIRNILNSLKDDVEVYDFVANYVNKVIKFNLGELETEKKMIGKNNFINDEQKDFFELYVNDKNRLFKENLIRVKNDGTVIYNNGRDIVIKDEKICSLIYLELWFCMNKTISDEELDRYKKGMAFSDGYTILEKRKWFVGIKHLLEKKGMLVMNSYTELDNSNEIRFNSFEKDKIPNFYDMKKIALKYEFKLVDNGGVKKEYVVVERKTGKVIKDDNIKKVARFANLWVSAFSFEQRIGDDFNKIVERAFDKDKEKLYDNILKIMFDGIKDNGNINVDKILRQYFNNKDKEYLYFNDKYYLQVVKNLFKMRENYEWVYEFMNLFSSDHLMQYKKEESYFEKMYGDYYVENDVNDIVKVSNRR